MFRTLILRSAAPLRQAIRPTPTSVSAIASVQIQSPKWRSYSAAAGLSKDAISERVLDVMKSFEKVDGGKLTANAAFTTDLGLDSLDAVEVVMAIEEEFGIEIPDAEADEITTVGQAIEYIAKTPEAH